jgi:hypothetical protein
MSELYDAELQAAANAAARSRRSDKRWKLILMVMSVLLGGMMVVAFWLATNNAQLAAENASFGAQQQGEKKEIAKEASKALCGEGGREIYDRDLCAKWAEAAQEPTMPPEAPPLDNGPSQAELVNAFREYCADGNCKGRDGQPPTADDIAAAFITFCADGRCVGQAGKDAAPGRDGKDAVALAPEYEMVLAAVTEVCNTGICTGPTGERGPGPTPEMVLAAVQQYCANDACRGPAGADSTVPGPSGAQGEPGRGIADTYCQDNGSWQITYTDGEVDSDAGQCRETKPVGGIL